MSRHKNICLVSLVISFLTTCTAQSCGTARTRTVGTATAETITGPDDTVTVVLPSTTTSFNTFFCSSSSVPVTRTATTTSFLERDATSYRSTVTDAATLLVVIGVPPTYRTVSTITSGTTGAFRTLTTATGTTPGAVIQVLPTPDLSCNNIGVEYAIQNNPYRNTDATYSNFNVSYFKTAPPLYQNVTTELGFRNPDLTYTKPFTIYNSPPRLTQNIALNHRGYLFAKLTGLYTFVTPSSDDITILWLGSTAFSGYTRDNALIVQPYTRDGSNSITRSFRLVQGQYYPIRILFGNGQEVAAFSFTITAPDGSVIIAEGTKGSPYLVQYSCDLRLGPRYPPFGQET